jgi:hypothetical protein
MMRAIKVIIGKKPGKKPAMACAIAGSAKASSRVI